MSSRHEKHMSSTMRSTMSGTPRTAPTRDKSRPWLLRAGRPRRPGSRLQTAIRRAFIVSSGQPLSTIELVRRCYPRAEQTGKLRRSHCVSVRRAARKVAVQVGYGRVTGRRSYGGRNEPPAAY
jgi:hypothetical protein